jgi:deoxyribose-phosphate aldolase
MGEKERAISAVEMAQTIDHTLLKPEATTEMIDKLCEEAVRFNFKAVCVNSGWVAHVADRLKGSDVAICSVVGFPLGATHTLAKAAEARYAVEDGAVELDMVLNIGALKSGELQTVEADIREVRYTAGTGRILKVIIETCLLTEEEKVSACEIAEGTGADFVKTSTGFAGGGASVADVVLMRQTVSKKIGIKASGGIKDAQTARSMILVGADRIGTSSGVAIVRAMA